MLHALTALTSARAPPWVHTSTVASLLSRCMGMMAPSCMCPEAQHILLLMMSPGLPPSKDLLRSSMTCSLLYSPLRRSSFLLGWPTTTSTSVSRFHFFLLSFTVGHSPSGW